MCCREADWMCLTVVLPSAPVLRQSYALCAERAGAEERTDPARSRESAEAGERAVERARRHRVQVVRAHLDRFARHHKVRPNSFMVDGGEVRSSGGEVPSSPIMAAASSRPACVPALNMRLAITGPTPAEILRRQILAAAEATAAEAEALAKQVGAQKAFEAMAKQQHVAQSRATKVVPSTLIRDLDEAKRERLNAFRHSRRAAGRRFSAARPTSAAALHPQHKPLAPTKQQQQPVRQLSHAAPVASTDRSAMRAQAAAATTQLSTRRGTSASSHHQHVDSSRPLGSRRTATGGGGRIAV